MDPQRDPPFFFPVAGTQDTELPVATRGYHVSLGNRRRADTQIQPTAVEILGQTLDMEFQFID